MDDRSRDAPPSGPPPAYQTVVRKVYAGSIRLPMLVICIITEIYLCWSGGAQIGSVRRYGFTGMLATLSIVQGSLYVGAGIIEFIGVLACVLERIPLARIYAPLSIVALVSTCASQLIGIVVHFTEKQPLLQACTNYNTGRTDQDWYSGWLLWPTSGDGSSAPISAQQASSYCSKRWSGSSAGEIIGLIVTIIVGLIFVSLSFMYLRELLDPGSLRRQAGLEAVIPLSSSINGQQQAWNHYYPQSNNLQGESMYPPPQGPLPGEYGHGLGEPLPPKYSREMARHSVDGPDRKSLSGPFGYGAFESHDSVNRDTDEGEEEGKGDQRHASSSR
ncbi:hypothetical protein K437DRAFT_254729 [Tilletiaria anomala UBC 951]|uniref:Uncharacterized protein n=1 Tax=Tilletiaria anomala (strain ATCC 24038 / CBS 436.72 / UBC 951) TaxID=1037660 RepID=A0A066WHJ5_TILAU|nr:uncharacterized protein K437DRAFT_254729 [Tilletiaria anomala UBC 951]KDN51988.1 hypothetical protein K437DRAFT_254729 [Tilletiaria anomala UBC 951]